VVFSKYCQKRENVVLAGNDVSGGGRMGIRLSQGSQVLIKIRDFSFEGD